MPKNWYFWTVVLEKTLVSPLNWKEIQPVNLKGKRSWIFIARTDAEAEIPIIWPPDMKNQLTGKKKPWCWERLKTWREGEDRGWDGWMASLMRWAWVYIDSSSWWWTRRPGKMQSWGRKELDRTESLNWTEPCSNQEANSLLNFLYKILFLYSVQFSSVAQSCLTLCNPMKCSTPGLPVHHQLLESTPTHVHWVSDAIQPSHLLLSPSPPALNFSQHQSLFKWVNSSHQVA